MENIVTFANENQLIGLGRVKTMINESENIILGFYSEEEGKLLLAERLQRIAEGNAVTVQHEEVKSHVKALLRDDYQMA